jgi:hypothetical protein
MMGAQGNPDDFGPQTPAAAGNAPPAPFALVGTFVSGTPWVINYTPFATGILIASSQAPTSAILGSSGVGGETIAAPITTITAAPGVLGELGLYYVPVISGPYGSSSSTSWDLSVAFPSSTVGFAYEVDEGQFPFGATSVQTPSVYTVIVPNHSAGADWSYTLPARARLCEIQAALAASAAVANRYPNLLWGPAFRYLAMCPAAVTAGQAAYVDGWTGPPMVPLVQSTSGSTLFSFPNQLLPAGSPVASITTGLQAADQWSNIQLIFSPV